MSKLTGGKNEKPRWGFYDVKNQKQPPEVFYEKW